MRRALVTGASGQDGFLMCQWLRARDYEVVATLSPAAAPEAMQGVRQVRIDLRDATALAALLRECAPTEIYNFAARATGAGMFDDVPAAAAINAHMPVALLDEVSRRLPGTRVLQASSSEVFGAAEGLLDEAAPRAPRSPYAAAKHYVDMLVSMYRAQHGVFACSAILFNHESPRRPESFVTRKVCRAAARIRHGLQHELRLGNLDSRRDWGFAGDYVQAMWRMLQAEVPRDFVLATGTLHSVRELCDLAFRRAGLAWQDHVIEDRSQARPNESPARRGDAALARSLLDWRPTLDFTDLVNLMVDHDLALAAREAAGTPP